MTDANGQAHRSESKAGAGAAGIGSGTGLVALANSLSDENELKPFLVWAAPTAAVVAGGLWLWAQAEISNYWRDRKVKIIAGRVKAHLVDAIEHTGDEARKRELQDRLHNVDIIIADKDINQLKTLTPTDAGKPQSDDTAVAGGVQDSSAQ